MNDFDELNDSIPTEIDRRKINNLVENGVISEECEKCGADIS